MKKDKAYTDEHAEAGIAVALPEIETWPNQFSDYEIEVVVDEFTSICPKTGLPDFGVITINYIPDKLCLELKSLKMYTVAYRNLGIFQENVVNCFVRDIVQACKPKQVTVTGDFVPRGGLGSRMVAHWEKKHSRGK
jgi:7-cyano-7-deazaguanine reductase